MGYLYFYSGTPTMFIESDEIVLVPYGVSIFLFNLFYSVVPLVLMFSSPMGYLYFYSVLSISCNSLLILCSRPLWGIYISIRLAMACFTASSFSFSSPMGYLYFYSLSSLSLICKGLILYFAVQNIFLDLSDLFY